MKTRIGLRAFTVILAMLLVSVIVVPAMAIDSKTSENAKLDIVDAETLQERSPSFINELRRKGGSEEEIAEAIVSYRIEDKYLDGWTEEEVEKLSEELRWTRVASHEALTSADEEKNSSIRLDGQYQSSSGMYLIDSLYKGVNGRVHPGPMECSSGSTIYQYLTSHLGKETNGQPNWIEIGIQTVSWRPNEYILFSWDENAGGGREMGRLRYTPLGGQGLQF